MLISKVLTILNGKIKNLYTWDINLFLKQQFSEDENIEVPAGKLLQVNSPILDGEIKPDGEVYIL